MIIAIGVVIYSFRITIRYPNTNTQSIGLKSISGLLNFRTIRAINTLEKTIEIKELMQMYFMRLKIKKRVFERIIVASIKKMTLFTIKCLFKYP